MSSFYALYSSSCCDSVIPHKRAYMNPIKNGVSQRKITEKKNENEQKLNSFFLHFPFTYLTSFSWNSRIRKSFSSFLLGWHLFCAAYCVYAHDLDLNRYCCVFFFVVAYEVLQFTLLYTPCTHDIVLHFFGWVCFFFLSSKNE